MNKPYCTQRCLTSKYIHIAGNVDGTTDNGNGKGDAVGDTTDNDNGKGDAVGDVAKSQGKKEEHNFYSTWNI